VVRGWALLLSVCALAGSATAHALELDETRRDFRLTLSQDYLHAHGATLLAGRYGGAWGLRLGYWMNTDDMQPKPHWVASVDHVWTLGRWRAGLGAAWIDKKTNVNGTLWLFDVSLAYDISRHVFVEYRHHSHGSKLGIKREVQNGGWNLIGIGLSFD
jgi:hypothetical protein